MIPKLVDFCKELLDRGDSKVIVVVLFVEELLDREDLKEEFFEKLLKRGDLETTVLFFQSESEEEIAEEDAVCEICFNVFKVDEDMVEIKCKCKSELVLEACVVKSDCGTCEQHIKKIQLALLLAPTSAWVSTQNGKKHM
ncbi:hypothetical protein LguiB_026501 [Lonicera macranthoides]